MNRTIIAIAVASLGLLTLVFAGCLSNPTGEVAGATVTSQSQKNMFVEREFAEDSTLAATLGHTVAIHLEAAGSHPGDTGSEDGVDEIPYVLPKSTTLSLAVPLNEGHGHWIEWCDSSGKQILMARNTQSSSRVKLKAGRYILKVHHTDAHNVDQTMYLRVASNKPATGTAQRLDYHPVGGYYGDGEDSVWCSSGYLNSDGDYEDNSVWISGDLSCANIVGADFSVPEYWEGDPEGGFRLIEFNNNSRNVVFTNCKFDRSSMNGTITDSTFTNCSFIDSYWPNFKAAGATKFVNCNFKNYADLFHLDVSGTTLTGCSFVGTKIGSAHFVGCTVQNCDFTNANFDGAVFDQSSSLFATASANKLSGAKFAGISVQQVSFVGTTISSFATDWSRANFSSADLTQQNLSTLNLTSAVFAATNLTKVTCTSNATLANDNFTGATLENADFTSSNFSHATLDHASAVATNFSNVTFDGISAHGASFEYSNLSNATFAGAQLGSAAQSTLEPASFAFAYMPNARITDSADCRNVNFTKAHLYGANASVQGAELTEAKFTDAIVSGMDFSGATLESASFENAQAVATKFVGARLNDASFIGAYLMGADFTNSFATSVNFSNAAISTAPCNNNANCSTCSGSTCSFGTLDPANLCCYSVHEADGTVYAVSFGATILPTDSSIFCPDGQLGPCTGAKLVPRDNGPFPAVPACVPSPFNWCPQPTN